MVQRVRSRTLKCARQTSAGYGVVLGAADAIGPDQGTIVSSVFGLVAVHDVDVVLQVLADAGRVEHHQHTYNVPGHPDGIVVDDSGTIWVSTNEDANAELIVINVGAGTQQTIQTTSRPTNCRMVEG